MTSNNLAYLFFFSILMVFLAWVFNISVFNECYNPARFALMASLLPQLRTQDCLMMTGAAIFLIITVIPITLAALLHLIFKLLKFSSRISLYALWMLWLGSVYFCVYELSFLIR